MKENYRNEEGFIQAESAELYYKIIGEGEPVVILHGGPGFDHNHMLPFDSLAEEYKVIFYDQRASGNLTGAVDSASITISRFVEDVEAVRKGLGLERMTLIGHSWGGNLAMMYLACRIYFAGLQAGELSQIQKLVLMK